MMSYATKTSWCEKLFLFSLVTISLIVGLDYKFAILPIHGSVLFAYLSFVIVVTTWITFIGLQNVLKNNRPFSYEASNHVLARLFVYLFKLSSKWKKQPPQADPTSNNSADSCEIKRAKNVDLRIGDFISDVEMRFVLKWYSQISQDPTFPSECKHLLDEIVRRFLQVIVEIDSNKLVYGCVTIFLRHIKEFRRTIKRSKSLDGTIEKLYRYSHIGSKSSNALDYFLHCLTANVLKQFINWELWNSVPCRTLVSILSRKFTAYVLVYISSPGLINYQLVNFCATQDMSKKLNLLNYFFISLSDVDHSKAKFPSNESATTKKQSTDNLKTLTGSETPINISRRPSTDVKFYLNSDKLQGYDVVDASQCTVKKDQVRIVPSSLDLNLSSKIITPSTICKQTINDKTEVQKNVSEPVKIYESNSTKTWRNSSDLECISLGQDILAFEDMNDPDIQIQELIEKKPWKDNIDSVEDEKANSWDNLEPWNKIEESDDQLVSPTSNLQTYLKPIGNVTANTLHNMKEFQQSTVNTVVKPMSQATSSAMHKIGDLQDEAAGVVEGILDFGIAGLRKGLRLTGLQENFSELAQKAKNEFQKPESNTTKYMESSKSIKIPEKDSKRNEESKGFKVNKLTKANRIVDEDKIEPFDNLNESDESIWINPIDSPNFDGNILLDKIPENSTYIEKQKLNELNVFNEQSEICKSSPKVPEEFLLSVDSPDPEYEEPQDLASTIAKLRSLLQQKSSESEFTTPSLSPMPQFEMDKTPSDPPSQDLTKVDGAMPSLYKFCARTATGVFQNTINTIKTALPGNINENSQNIIQYNSEDWTFVEADASKNDFYSRMRKLLVERRQFCSVDTAYEAIDSLEFSDQPDIAWTSPTTAFEDELDDFEVHVPITKAIVDVLCELIGDTNTYLLRESVVKTLMLLIGHYTEEIIQNVSESIPHKINKCIGKLPENLNQNVMTMKLDQIIKICMETFPEHVKTLFEEEILSSGMELLILSLQSQKINQDIFLQILELFSSQLIVACSQASPSYSA